MRKVLYGAASSLDGFIAARDDVLDWLLWNDEVAGISAASLEGVDTMIMGRRTWEVGRAAGTPHYPGYRNVVFSRTLAPGSAPGVEILDGDVADVVRRMKREPGGGICIMGGGQIGAALLAAGLVDEVGVNIHPVLLGSGVPMFPLMGEAGRRTELERLEARPLANGCVFVLYRVIGAAGA